MRQVGWSVPSTLRRCDIATVLAIGADWANAARGYMFALGCIQSMSCHTNRCPTGVATQDPTRERARADSFAEAV